ncbi:MAG: glycosyltransferase family 2 protein [Proteobacteria bacterium]|nr:glycosyltransferase family 2 protein [Pseudomonadota bacterium]
MNSVSLAASAFQRHNPPAKPLVTLVIPAFNEEAVLESTLAEISQGIAPLREQYEFEALIVNDGSSDATAEIAEGLAQRLDWVRVIHHPKNRGLSEALRTGFANSKSRYVIVLDADMSYSADHIPALLEAIARTSTQMVLASPYMTGGKISGIPPFRYALSRVANRFLSWISQSKLSTLTGMVRIYDGAFIRGLVLRGNAMAAMPEIIYKSMILRANVAEIPAHLDWSKLQIHQGRRRSSMRILSQIFSTVMSGFAFRPFMFFILPGLLLSLFSAYVVVWMFIHYFEALWQLPPNASDITLALRTAYLHYPYTYIVGLLSTMVSIQLLALGILALQAKRYFEESFNLGSTLNRRLLAIEERLPPRD